jgi:hypothetical protein
MVLPLADPTRFGFVSDAYDAPCPKLLSKSYLAFSAKLSGVTPSLLVMIGLAPCSNKYLTMR